MQVTGATVQELNTEPLNSLFNGVMANVSQQCTQYITSSAVSAARRRLLQAGAASVTATVSSNTPETVQTNFAGAESNGRLAELLREIGLELVPGSLSYVSNTDNTPPAPPPPDSSGGGLGTGAIVGIAVGAAALVLAAGGGYWYYRRKKAKQAAAAGAAGGQNKGAVFTSGNAAFDEETGELAEPKGGKGREKISSADNAAFGTDDAEGGGNPLYATGAAAGVAGATYGKAAGGRDMSTSENPFYGQTDEAGNPLYGVGEDSPTALAGVKTGRNTNADNPMFGGLGDDEPNAANPIFSGDDSPVKAGAMYGAGPEHGGDRQFGNQMFRGDGILDSQEVRPGGDEGANPLYATNNSQLSAPDSPGGYAAAAAAQPGGGASQQSQMMSARSRQESARDGVTSNPIFTDTGISSDDEMVDASGAMANPMYQSAQSGQSREDIYASAGSMGGDYGAAAPTAAGPAGGSSSGQPFSNPLAGGDGGGEEEEEAGQNPLFAQQQAPAVRPPSATSLSFKPAGLKK